jgi:DNA-directed RNA polymerase specialized sigma subunit
MVSGGEDMEDIEFREINRKKRFLKRYKKNLACIARLEEKRITLDERIRKMKTSNLSGMPRGGVPITVDDLISDKMELEKRIKRLQAKKADLKSEILEEIDTLEDPRYCEILESFFIDCISLEDIAENEGYTVRHVYRLYKEAVILLAQNGQ